eukprot:scaffold721_cov131-Cylindrotheca_fusiformis.AAC.39
MHQDQDADNNSPDKKSESGVSQESFSKSTTSAFPSPKSAEKCPLFSVFYSEFDIKVGPVICFQTPKHFMDQDINISTEKIHEILTETFNDLQNNKAEAPNQVTDDDESTAVPEGALSIFDSTSEYIITGNELTDKIITLSTHGLHIMTRPTHISDERYERNSLMYEFTPKATAMLAGKEPKLVQEAVDFVMKKPGSIAMHGAFQGGIGDPGSEAAQAGSPLQFTPSSSYPPRSLGPFGGSARSSNFRYAMMLANSLENDSSIVTRREEQRNLRVAISELYCACNRNCSFGDLWIALTAETPVHSATFQRPSRKISIEEEPPDSDPLEPLAFSPVEANQLESGRKSNAEDRIDWEDVFKRFDHRRLFSFGLIHNLVVRVHEYPYFPGVFPSRRKKEAHHGMESAKQSIRKDFLEEKSYLLARNVASLMDGTRCDDEFVCIFEKPYKELVRLVEKFSGEKIVSLLMAS